MKKRTQIFTLNISFTMYVPLYIYSGISDKGHSEIGIASLQRTLLLSLVNRAVYYLTSKIRTPLYKGQNCRT